MFGIGSYDNSCLLAFIAQSKKPPSEEGGFVITP
jgi:hypothetical protein